MRFTARIHGEVDQAMTLFQLRRIGANGDFILAPKGGTDVQIIGDVPGDKFDALVQGLCSMKGAIHAEGRHVRLTGGGHEDHDSILAAEEPFGGPFTIPGSTRATWSFGGDVADHIVQVLHADEEHIPVTVLRERLNVGIERVVPALKQLTADGVVRKFRHEDGSDAYGLARAVRDRIDATMEVTPQA